MKNFTCVQDIGNLNVALQEAFEIKNDRFKYVELGRNKTLMMIFFIMLISFTARRLCFLLLGFYHESFSVDGSGRCHPQAFQVAG